jgi:hypothetical protein
LSSHPALAGKPEQHGRTGDACGNLSRMHRMKRLSVNVMATAALLVGLAACQKQSDGEQKGAAEKAGAQIDAAAAKAGEALNKAGEKTGQAMQKGGEKMEDAYKNVQKKE